MGGYFHGALSTFVYQVSNQTFSVATLSSDGSVAYIVKYSPMGSYLWSTRVDGNAAEIIQAMAADKEGNIIAVGTYTSFPGLIYETTSSQPVATLPLPDSAATFIYSPQGSYLWHIYIDGDVSDFDPAVAISPDKQLVIAGSYSITPSIYHHYRSDSRTALVMLPQATETAAYVVKFHTDAVPLSLCATRTPADRELLFDYSYSAKTNEPAATKMVPSDDRDGNNSVLTQSEFNAIVGSVLGVALGIISIAICLAAAFRQRHKMGMKQITSYHEYETKITSMPSTMMTTTWIVTGHEFSIPAFLEMRWGIDFRQEEFIAKGGGGELYTCAPLCYNLIDVMTGEGQLVLKVVNSESLDGMSIQMRRAFFQEISIMYRFRDHPNFCHVLAFSIRPVCLVMKLYKHGDWDTSIQKKHHDFLYTKRRVLKLFYDVCLAIGYMHQCGFVHCDIKPANVLLDESIDGDLVATVSDFGLSKAVDPSQLNVSAFELADLNGFSVSYAAPETFVCFRRRNWTGMWE